MVQGYYTLQEAAQVLGLAPEELKQMAQANQIRSFQDRGTWRFRVQDIQELARQRGAASDPELHLGEARSPQPKSAPKSGPKSGPRTPSRSPLPRSPKPHTPDVFDFAVDPGVADFPVQPSSGPRKPDSKRPSPLPPGSDSDVRLVAEGDDLGFAIGGDSGPTMGSDSDVKLVGPAGGDAPLPPTPKAGAAQAQRRSGLAGKQATPPGGKRPSQLSPQPPSSPRLLPTRDSDSDVKIVGAPGIDVPLGEAPEKTQSDSDIRLESIGPPRSSAQEGMLTDEIDLDAELRRQEAAQQKPQAKIKPKSKLPKFPQSSPFELSDSDPAVSPPRTPAPRTPTPRTPTPRTPASAKPDSSDYDLTPSSPREDSSEDFTLDLPGDSDFGLQLGDSGELKGPSSGINLSKPVDSGISLEAEDESSDSVDFELSLDVPQPTPRTPRTPKKPAKVEESPEDSSSEFELTLDVDDSAGPALTPEDSDSEFELTLDDSAELGADVSGPQAKAGSKDKDIFETDFDLPAQDDSGSQVAPLETDLDSSDFDLAVSDSDIALDEESGSQVVALDEEEAEPGAATVAAKRKTRTQAADFGFEEEVAVQEPVVERETVVQEVVRYVKPAPWGVLPTLVMLPCLVIMVLVGIMGFELVQHMTSYEEPGPLTKAIGKMVGKEFK